MIFMIFSKRARFSIYPLKLEKPNKNNLKVQNFKQWLSLWENAKERRIGKHAFKYPLPTYKNNKRDLSNLV